MINPFEKIAIIGSSCILPGCHTPKELSEIVINQRVVISDVPENYWRVSTKNIVAADQRSLTADQTLTDRGGYVTGFEDIFQADGFKIEGSLIKELDTLFQWCLHTGREALSEAKTYGSETLLKNTGVIMGNLLYPTSSLYKMAEDIYLEKAGFSDINKSEIHPYNRFMSGLPAILMAKALGIKGGAFSIDAACASSLYAIKLACDRLHRHEADMMLAGAVSCSDPLFPHVGFSQINAMSPSGLNKPFSIYADGLIPAQGAAFVVLKRLEDAEKDKDNILGVICGIGLSNDGRSGGFLSPSYKDQVRCMKQAYEMSGISPSEVSYIECHATGTVIGDSVEIKSMSEIFPHEHRIPLGSLKANLGHLITTSGTAGLIKVLGMFRERFIPGTPNAYPVLPEIQKSAFYIPEATESWCPSGKKRIAAISNFGFGGNNAHLIVEEYIKNESYLPITVEKKKNEPVAVIGVSVRTNLTESNYEFLQKILQNDKHDEKRESIDVITFSPGEVPFPPKDLEKTIGQQLLLLKTATEAMSKIKKPDNTRTAVYVGMETDSETTRGRLRWTLEEVLKNLDCSLTKEELEKYRDIIVYKTNSASYVGSLANILANRINNQYDLKALGFAVANEALSGDRALELACHALNSGEIDTAVVGAVDMCRQIVHEKAVKEALPEINGSSLDAAVVLIVKRLEDAIKDGDTILCSINSINHKHEPDDKHYIHLGNCFGCFDISKVVGYSHAASGMLNLAAGVLMLSEGVFPDCIKKEELLVDGNTSINICNTTFLGEGMSTVLNSWNSNEDRAENENLYKNPSKDKNADKAYNTLIASKAPGKVFSYALQLPDLGGIAELREIKSGNGFSEERTNPEAAGCGRVLPTPPDINKLDYIYDKVILKNQYSNDHLNMSPFEARQSEVKIPGAAAAILTCSKTMEEVHFKHLDLKKTSHENYMNLLTGLRKKIYEQMNQKQNFVQSSLENREAAHSHVEDTIAQKPQLPAINIEKQESLSDWKMPEGPAFGRNQLEALASGRISSVFGKSFEPQAGYSIQVRMPMPPMLLCDRVTGIQGEPLSMGRGMIWTETDVQADAWYLHQGRMPAGIFMEAGQADLLLSSWLGIDMLNKGERAYRLLGCELVFHGSLPKVGETLQFQISGDGFANHGDVRLFFFHYICRVNGETRISMTNGQAGFFTKDELDNSQGLVWSPCNAVYTKDARIDPPLSVNMKNRYTEEDIKQYHSDNFYACFGNEFKDRRLPTYLTGQFLLFDEILSLDTSGGPKGRGYLAASMKINPKLWFFKGHFLNDPCMPGTLMAEAFLQIMAFYLTANGYTLGKEDWHFEPVQNEKYKFTCRGQVAPASKQVIYELFIDEIINDPIPTIFAHILGTVDGLKAMGCERLGLRLVPGNKEDNKAELVRSFGGKAAIAEKIAVSQQAAEWINNWEISLEEKPWIMDHCPTFTIPTLPLTYELDMMVDSVLSKFPEKKVILVDKLEGNRWMAFYGNELKGRTIVKQYGSDNFEVIMEILETGINKEDYTKTASCCVTLGNEYTMPEEYDALPVTNTVAMASPYLDGTVFHGPSLQLMQEWKLGSNGASCLIDAKSKGVPFGRVNPGALDAALHAIPHNNMGIWDKQISDNMISYPVRIENFRLFNNIPSEGLLEVNIKLEKIVAKRLSSVRFIISSMDKQVCSFKLIEMILPKGSLINSSPKDRRDFLMYRRFIPGLTISKLKQEGCSLKYSDVLESNFLKGSVEQVFKVEGTIPEMTEKIALKEYAASKLYLHPSDIVFVNSGMKCLNTPLNNFSLQSVKIEKGVDILPSEPSGIDLEYFKGLWISRNGNASPIMLDIGLSLLNKYMRRLILKNPSEMAKLKGKPALYLANHQTMIESFLFLLLMSGIQETPLKVMSKKEHKETLMSKLVSIGTEKPAGGQAPFEVLYVNRENQMEMLNSFNEIADEMSQSPFSLFVHIEGQRALFAGKKIERLSSVLVDIALKFNLPIIPVRFYGGLPLEPAGTKLDFPLNNGMQDIYIGDPIPALEIQELAYSDRVKRVLSDMNSLGAPYEFEKPLSPDMAFNEAVLKSMADLSIQALPAAIIQSLRLNPILSEETKTFMDALLKKSFKPDRGDEAARIAKMLFL